ADHFVEAGRDVDRMDVRARHHDVPHLELAETQRIEQKLAFLLGELGAVLTFLPLVLLDQLLERLAQRVLPIAPLGQDAQAGEQSIERRNVRIAPACRQFLHRSVSVDSAPAACATGGSASPPYGSGMPSCARMSRSSPSIRSASSASSWS